jgi:hypothetical protein
MPLHLTVGTQQTSYWSSLLMTSPEAAVNDVVAVDMMGLKKG